MHYTREKVKIEMNYVLSPVEFVYFILLLYLAILMIFFMHKLLWY